MQRFIHQGSGAVVYVSDTGRKQIVKHGVTFTSFAQLRAYEKNYKNMLKQNEDVVSRLQNDNRLQYRHAKGDI